MSFSERISPLIGRFVIAWFFIHEAFERGANWNGTLGLMALQHIPAPPLMLAIALMVMMIGGISLALGYHARHGAILLFGFTIAVTIVMHGYWRISDPLERAAEFQIFARNITIAGALLLIVGMGAGPFALDNVGSGGGKKR